MLLDYRVNVQLRKENHFQAYIPGRNVKNKDFPRSQVNGQGQGVTRRPKH